MTKENRVTAIFEAFDDQEPFDYAYPERNLLRAILRTAMSDIQKAGDLQDQAKDFFLSKEEDYIFSFRSICYFLDIDPTQVLFVTGLAEKESEDQPKCVASDKVEVENKRRA